MIYRFLFIVIIASTLYSCADSHEETTDDFNRAILLQEWADNLIIPAYEFYRNGLSEMEFWVKEFQEERNSESLDSLRSAYIQTYRLWQYAAQFNIGKAEEIQLINYTNIYPTDTVKILANVESQEFNLILPSNYVAQGFPAIDFLLFRVASSEQAVQYLDLEKTAYLIELISELIQRTTSVIEDWSTSYREAFINKSGSSATASVDKMVNDYIYYLEKHVRAAKVGIPAGVFSGGLLPQNVEAIYAEDINQVLLRDAVESLSSFYYGKSDGNGQDQRSLASYVQTIDSKIGSESLHTRISSQFDHIFTAIDELDSSLQRMTEVDNSKMLATYDELQKLVILFKVDMLQLLNIQVDYVDADGD